MTFIKWLQFLKEANFQRTGYRSSTSGTNKYRPRPTQVKNPEIAAHMNRRFTEWYKNKFKEEPQNVR